MDKDREFVFTEGDFEQVRKLVYQRAGISLNHNKKDMVYSRLSRRLRANGLSAFKDYLELLEYGEESELEAFTNALTTNLTSFFRERHHFHLLANHLKQQTHKHDISLWCSACSTGEEAYSIAMTLVNVYGTFSPNAKILATDIDTNVLEQAKSGVYPVEKIKEIDPEYVKKYFYQGIGKNQGLVRVRPELKDLITFRRLNLLDEKWPMRKPFDAIFCRNVMIYFDKKTQYEILKKFAPLLKPNGLLFAGHSESFSHAADLFKIRGKTVYELSKVPENKVENET